MSSKSPLLRLWLTGLTASLLSLSLFSTSLANSGDWVQVKRFNGQLEQAKAGDANAMYEVGYMYERGRGVDTNLSQAIHWYEQAASAGSGNGQARLGMMYFYGRGVNVDYVVAYQHIQKAANAKVPLAQYYLGRIYETGKGTKQDYRAALKWYTASAKNGYYDPQGRIVAVKKALETEKYGDFPKRSKEASQLKLARGLLQTVMKGDWQRAGKPANYLPSAKTVCKKKGKKRIRCTSERLVRNSGGNVITYVTVSTLTGFNRNQQFRISYHNNVLQVHREGETPQYDDEEEFSAATPQNTGNIKLGKQKTKHILNCALEKNKKQSGNRLVCIKNRSNTLEFKDKKS